METPSFLPLVLTWLAVSLLPSVKSDISIELADEFNSPYESYGVVEFFRTNYANTGGSMVGYLHQPSSRNGCTYIPHLPESATNQTWIALIEDYPICVTNMVNYVRNAGYTLLLTSSPNDTHFRLTANAKNMGFPIVLIKDSYMRYLLEVSASNTFDNPQVMAQVITNMAAFVTVCVLGFGFILLPSCLLCCLCCLWCTARRRRRRLEDEMRYVEERRRNYSRGQNREHMARQELIESILRQLQQLQLEGQAQRPLGEERTQRLPTERYTATLVSSGSGKGGLAATQEACAICVDDFRDGDMMRVLPCNHHFHIKCIDEWLINHSDLCPLCKKQLPRGEDGGERVGVQRRGRQQRRRPNLNDLVTFTDEETEPDTPPELDGGQDRLLLPGARPGSRGYGSV